MATLENWYQFTDDECDRLSEWQERFEAEQDERLAPMLRRLEFAKWLVEHGVISEMMDGGDKLPPAA